MEHHVIKTGMTATRDLSPDPHRDSGTGPAEQALSTIDSGALLTAASPEDQREEHRQALKDPKSSCVLLERHRRRRITQSSCMLRQLLPTIPGRRTDMVTVLEMTAAFLETVQQIVSAEDPNIQLCPPAELHADWLLQSQESRQFGSRMAARLKKQTSSAAL